MPPLLAEQSSLSPVFLLLHAPSSLIGTSLDLVWDQGTHATAAQSPSHASVLPPWRSRCRASWLTWPEDHGRSLATLRVATGAPHRRAAPAPLLHHRRAVGRSFPSPVPPPLLGHP
jgi:hypothetical protein